MRAIGKLPKGVLILEFIGMMLLAVALLSVSDSLSLPEPLLNLFVAIAPFAISLMNPFPKRSVRRLLTAPVRRPVPVFCSAVALFALPTKRYVKNW